MKPLYEEYRPQTLDEIAGQPEAVKKVRFFADRAPCTGDGHYPGLVGRVFWITGVSGVGKTTIARIIANMVSMPYAIQEFDAADLSIDRLRDIERECRMRPMGCLAHAYIVNEAHSLRDHILARLNTTLELKSVQANSVWCFTTTLAGEKRLFDADQIERVPFGSRTIPLKLETKNVVDLAIRVQEVARKANLDGQPLAKYVTLLQSNEFNLRKCLQDIDAGLFAK